MKIYSPHPLAKKFPLLKGDEYDDLKESIRQRGQLEPGTLLDGLLLDGRNRQEVCRELGIPFKTVEWNSRRGETPAGFVDAMNLKRRHLTSSQQAMIAAALMPHFQAEAKERQREAAKVTAAKKKRDEKMKPSERGAVKSKTEKKPAKRAASEAAKAAGVKASTRSIERAAFVKEKSPELAKQVFDGELTVKQAEKQIRRADQLEKVKAYVPPTGQFATIAIDWPWRYRDTLSGSNMERELPYPPMSDEEILASINALPVAANCALFCWVTMPIMLDHGGVWPRIVEKLGLVWGFELKQARIWAKTEASGQPVTVLGGLWRVDAEVLVRFERGECAYLPTGEEHGRPIQRTIFAAPVGANSEKPDRAYDDIAAVCPMTPRLEMYARKPRDGWTTSGAELEKPDVHKDGESQQARPDEKASDVTTRASELPNSSGAGSLLGVKSSTVPGHGTTASGKKKRQLFITEPPEISAIGTVGLPATAGPSTTVHVSKVETGIAGMAKALDSAARPQLTPEQFSKESGLKMPTIDQVPNETIEELAERMAKTRPPKPDLVIEREPSSGSPELDAALSTLPPHAFEGPLVPGARCSQCDLPVHDPVHAGKLTQAQREVTAGWEPPAGMSEALAAAEPKPTAESLKPMPDADIPF